MKKILIIGGDAAGMSAAEKIRRLRSDYDIQVLERGHYTSYGACGIPYYIGGKIHTLDKLISRTRETFAKHGINVHLHHEATKILPQKREVLANTPQGEKTFSYERLLLATGAAPIIPPLPGIDLTGVFALRGLEEAKAMQNYISKEPGSVAIIGGGYIGLEMAESLKRRGFKVDIFEMQERILVNFEEELAEEIQGVMEEKGIGIYLNTPVEEIKGEERVNGVKAGGQDFFCDMVLVAIGVRPMSDLAKDAGIEIGLKGAISVNKHLQTNIPHIFAAGDCIETRNLITDRPTHIPLALTANRSGVIAGENMAGQSTLFRGVLGTAALKIFHLYLARTGLSTREAKEAGLETTTVDITSSSRAGYYPGGHRIRVLLILEKGTGRILGGQLLGGEEVGSKIDVLATAITRGMTVEDFFHLDLAYAPPIGPVWDPLLTAARVGLKQI